jgi:hypothetical protein
MLRSSMSGSGIWNTSVASTRTSSRLRCGQTRLTSQHPSWYRKGAAPMVQFKKNIWCVAGYFPVPPPETRTFFSFQLLSRTFSGIAIILFLYDPDRCLPKMTVERIDLFNSQTLHHNNCKSVIDADIEFTGKPDTFPIIVGRYRFGRDGWF